MKMIGKSILTLAAVAALSVPAMAANKLIVNNSSAAPVFQVDDAGVTSGVLGKFGIGTLTPASTFTVQDTVGTGTRGIAAYQLTNDGFAAQVDFRKAKGTPAAGAAAVVSGDYIGAFHGRAWDGTAWRTGATINYFVDNTPGAAGGNGGVPMALLFSTGSNDDGLTLPKTARMVIGSTGKLSIGNGTAAAQISGTGLVDMNADTIRLRGTRTPTGATACYTGEISWDSNYLYVCVSGTGTAGTWKRSALSSF